MRAQEFVPELVLCSTARRARETLERIEPAHGGAPVLLESELYGASARGLLARLRPRLPDDAGSVLLIGHNPGMHELASELAGSAPGLPGRFLTGALATLAFHTSAWSELGPRSDRAGRAHPPARSVMRTLLRHALRACPAAIHTLACMARSTLMRSP